MQQGIVIDCSIQKNRVVTILFNDKTNSYRVAIHSDFEDRLVFCEDLTHAKRIYNIWTNPN